MHNHSSTPLNVAATVAAIAILDKAIGAPDVPHSVRVFVLHAAQRLDAELNAYLRGH